MKLQQPWSRGHIPSCSAVTQHRPWAVGGSASAPTILRSRHTCRPTILVGPPSSSVSATILWSHHTCRPTILLSISPTIIRLHTCTILAGLPYLLVGPSYYQTCRQAPHTFEYFKVFPTYFVSAHPLTDSYTMSKTVSLCNIGRWGSPDTTLHTDNLHNHNNMSSCFWLHIYTSKSNMLLNRPNWCNNWSESWNTAIFHTEHFKLEIQ